MGPDEARVAAGCPSRLLAAPTLTDTDINELTALCRKEGGVSLPDEEDAEPIPLAVPGGLNSEDPTLGHPSRPSEPGGYQASRGADGSARGRCRGGGRVREGRFSRSRGRSRGCRLVARA